MDERTKEQRKKYRHAREYERKKTIEYFVVVNIFSLGHFEFALVVFTSFASFFRVSSFFFFFSFLIKFIIKSRS